MIENYANFRDYQGIRLIILLHMALWRYLYFFCDDLVADLSCGDVLYFSHVSYWIFINLQSRWTFDTSLEDRN